MRLREVRLRGRGYGGDVVEGQNLALQAAAFVSGDQRAAKVVVAVLRQKRLAQTRDQIIQQLRHGDVVVNRSRFLAMRRSARENENQQGEKQGFAGLFHAFSSVSVAFFTRNTRPMAAPARSVGSVQVTKV